MNKMKRILIASAFIVILGISWISVLTAKSAQQKQTDLLAEADAYLADKVYVLAMPLLEEAAAISSELTAEAEIKLRSVYLELDENNKYKELLSSMMAGKNATPGVFMESAAYYFEQSKPETAFEILRNGISKFSDNKKYDATELLDYYESVRYAFEIGREYFEDLTAVSGGFIQVKRGGLWGLASYSGVPAIPCMYDSISTYSQDRAIVMLNKEVSAVDLANRRLALLKTPVEAIGNYGNGRLPALYDGKWIWASSNLQAGKKEYEETGMYANGYVAVKKDGKWGVIDVSQEIYIPFEYEGIVMDEIGRCFAQNAVFVRNNEGVTLFEEGRSTGKHFEDAKPFATGLAAIKLKGKWGFVDVKGEVMIEAQFDDALSFFQHLAAVKQGDNWGYINKKGQIVIQPAFAEVRSFYNGSAPVYTNYGWRFITLLEYKKGAVL